MSTDQSLADDCRDISQRVHNKSRNARNSLVPMHNDSLVPTHFGSISEEESATFRKLTVTPTSSGSPDPVGSGVWGTDWADRKPKGFSQFKVAFLAGWRALLEDEPEAFDSDKAVFALRISMIANYGMVLLSGTLAGLIYFSAVVVSPAESRICMVASSVMAALFFIVHFANRFAWMKQQHLFAAWVLILVLSNLMTPLVLQILKCSVGWHWSGSTAHRPCIANRRPFLTKVLCLTGALFIWMLGAPVGTVVLTDRPAGICERSR
eukprot:1627886-Rhodomonas_salina.1